MANGVMRCHRLAMHRSFSRSKVPPLLSSSPVCIPSILSSVYSPPLTGALNLPPSSLLSLPPFSPSRTCVCARAFGLFSCFYAPLVFSLPKYNWRCDAPVSLSLSTPWPPSLACFFWRGPCGPARSPRESDFGESWTRAGNLLTRGCRRQEALIVRYLGDLLLKPYSRPELRLQHSGPRVIIIKRIIIKLLHCIFFKRK